jgi:hypothetical protein
MGRAYVFYEDGKPHLYQAPYLVKTVDWETVDESTSEQVILDVGKCLVHLLDELLHVTILDHALVLYDNG